MTYTNQFTEGRGCESICEYTYVCTCDRYDKTLLSESNPTKLKDIDQKYQCKVFYNTLDFRRE